MVTLALSSPFKYDLGNNFFFVPPKPARHHCLIALSPFLSFCLVENVVSTSPRLVEVAHTEQLRLPWLCGLLAHASDAFVVIPVGAHMINPLAA